MNVQIVDGNDNTGSGNGSGGGGDAELEPMSMWGVMNGTVAIKQNNNPFIVKTAKNAKNVQNVKNSANAKDDQILAWRQRLQQQCNFGVLLLANQVGSTTLASFFFSFLPLRFNHLVSVNR
jgi:hypothetical protein